MQSASSASETRPTADAGSARLVRQFREHASRAPNRIAIEADDETLSYGELDELSSRLARRLRERGVGPGVIVGVSTDRGARELVAMLAITKAGGAYLPLDPEHPAERLAMIVEDAAPRVSIVDRSSPFAGRLDAIAIDDLHAATRDHAPLETIDDEAPGALAYVMFTSGSTGRPKGVEIPRGALANFLVSMADTPGMAEGERLLAITTTSFDISGLELWLPLFVGGTTAIASRALSRDPQLLRQRLERGDIDVMQATPVTWRLLLEAGWKGDPRVRMLCGGEALSDALARRLLPSGAELWNLYGPTETTIWSALERIEPDFQRIAIGRPIANTSLVILGGDRRPLPPGEEGELAIGGAGLARGYFGRPDLTAERFIVPSEGGEERLYRTGNLAKALPDGRIVWLGRIDHQVKIRGNRVELGEIESTLRTVAGVDEVVVHPERHDDADVRLVAYWKGDAKAHALKEHARARLPDYMIPACWIPVARFPTNTNGKVDRAALAELSRQPEPAERTLPTDDTQARIATVFRDVLGVPEVGIDEDFFDIGGTSVLATRVLARLRDELGLPLPLGVLYDHPTAAALARALGDAVSPDAPIVVRLSDTGEGPPLFCLFGVSLYMALARALPPERPVVGMHLPFRYVPGRDPMPDLERVAAGYVELIRRHQPHGPYRLFGLCYGGVIGYEVARQLEADGETVESVVIVDAVLPQAMHSNRGERLLAVMRGAPRVLRNRDRIKSWLRWRGRYVVARIPGVRALLQRRAAQRGEPVDLPYDGPDVDAELTRYASARTRLAARLLVVRATAEELPTWVTVDPDHGWAHRAREVEFADVAATHESVMKAPHVNELARAVVAHG